MTKRVRHTHPAVLSIVMMFIAGSGCSQFAVNDLSDSIEADKTSSLLVAGFDYSDNVPASQSPPGGLKVSQVPMFVTIGFDDNGYSGEPGSGADGGMKWIIDYLKGKKNPTGSSNPATYDNSEVTVSFYFTAWYIHDWIYEGSTYVKKGWRKAMAEGHEIGNHTFRHKNGSDFSVAQWKDEINGCTAWLCKPYDPNLQKWENDITKGIGATHDQIFGFRAPFLDYNNNMFIALRNLGYWYDCSIEDGFQDDQDGSNYSWPYTLDSGSPGHAYKVRAGGKNFSIGSHSGLWEMPLHPVIIPEAKRDQVAKKLEGFNRASGKTTALDYDMFEDAKMTKAEALATLKHTLDLRLQGNRAPFMFGAHTNLYSSKNGGYQGHIARQEVIQEFLEYALSFPEVRVVSVKKILDWCRNPVPLITSGHAPNSL